MRLKFPASGLNLFSCISPARHRCLPPTTGGPLTWYLELQSYLVSMATKENILFLCNTLEMIESLLRCINFKVLECFIDLMKCFVRTLHLNFTHTHVSSSLVSFIFGQNGPNIKLTKQEKCFDAMIFIQRHFSQFQLIVHSTSY